MPKHEYTVHVALIMLILMLYSADAAIMMTMLANQSHDHDALRKYSSPARSSGSIMMTAGGRDNGARCNVRMLRTVCGACRIAIASGAKKYICMHGELAAKLIGIGIGIGLEGSK